MGVIEFLFVGPKGKQTHLERSALKMDDIRLRPDVIDNNLVLRHILHGTIEMPPDIEEIKAQLQEHGNIEDHMQQTHAANKMDKARHPTRRKNTWHPT